MQYSTSSITIGQFFRDERLRAQLSESDAASALGISNETLFDYETGRVQIPFDVIYSIAQLYSSSIEEILDLLVKVSFIDHQTEEKKRG